MNNPILNEYQYNKALERLGELKRGLHTKEEIDEWLDLVFSTCYYEDLNHPIATE